MAMINFLRYWLPLIAYCLCIIIQSHFPTPEAVPRLPFIDKLLHTGGYALLGVLFCRAYHFRWPQASQGLIGRASVLSAVLFGLSDEIHQYFVPLRSAEALDVLADAVGGFLGVLVFQAYLSSFSQRSADARRLTKQIHSDKEPSDALRFKL
jgi:VanZ family protein